MTQKISVQDVINKLPSRFISAAGSDLELVYQFKLEDNDDFYIQISNGQCQTHFGLHDDPNITLLTTGDTFMRVVNGEQDGMSAYLKGQLRAEGNVMLATKLGKLFSREKQA